MAFESYYFTKNSGAELQILLTSVKENACYVLSCDGNKSLKK